MVTFGHLLLPLIGAPTMNTIVATCDENKFGLSNLFFCSRCETIRALTVLIYGMTRNIQRFSGDLGRWFGTDTWQDCIGVNLIHTIIVACYWQHLHSINLSRSDERFILRPTIPNYAVGHSLPQLRDWVFHNTPLIKCNFITTPFYALNATKSSMPYNYLVSLQR